ncbi:phage tail domain-containing protein [Paenibacillus sp. sgz302251]|uniref:phage tail domain-containing protein n=1 Tax=Paenibacillus sp. sgz302251 TaxID=3414493 RepID=UPI003C7B0D0F
MTEVWLGDKSFTELGLVLLKDNQRPILPQTIDRTVLISGKNGAYDFGSDLGVRQFDLGCAFVKTKSTAELQLAIRQLIRHLLDDKGRPKTLELKFSTESDKMYYVRYSGDMPIERIAEYGTFTLPLVAFDSYAYQTELSTEITWDSELSMDSDITFDDEFVFTINGQTTINVNNFGYVSVSPVIEINGSFANINISANGKTFVYSEAFSGVMKIDNDKMTVKAGNTNLLVNSSGDFVELIPGINEIDITGTDVDASVSFIFRAKFM